MNVFENDLLACQLFASVPEVASPKSPPTADDLLRMRRRRSAARRCIIATGGAACLWLLGVLFWSPPRPSSSPRIATSGDAGTRDPVPRHVTSAGQLAHSTIADARVGAENLQPHTPVETVAPAAVVAPVPSDSPVDHRPVRVVWTNVETGRSVAIGYLRPARIRQLPMWKLPPAVQQDIRQHAEAIGDSPGPEI